MRTHRVKPGDTLGRIARKYYGDPGLFGFIVLANRIANPDRLAAGRLLLIPDLPDAAPAPPRGAPADATAVLGARMIELNEQRLAKLHPELAALARTMVALCARAGVPILVTQGLRTWAEQDALYARGRTAPPIGRKYIVTKAKGGQSWHNFGLAFDIVVLDALGKANWDTGHPGWAAAAKIGKSLGLEWGGDWTGFKDLAHFERTGDLTLADSRELFASGLEAVWERLA